MFTYTVIMRITSSNVFVLTVFEQQVKKKNNN